MTEKLFRERLNVFLFSYIAMPQVLVCVGDKSLLVQSGDQHKFLVELHMVEGITLLLDHMASCKTPRVVVTCLNTYQDERLRDILMADTDTLESCLHLADPSEVSLIQNNERLISRVKEAPTSLPLFS